MRTNSEGVAPHIVLVHGLGRSQADMFLLRPRLRKRFPHCSIHTFGYPSRSLRITEIAKRLGDFVSQRAGSEPVSFIGHSLGGLIVRTLDAQKLCSTPLHRLVTLGTPHQGAAIARFLCAYPLARRFFGSVLEDIAHFDGSFAPCSLEVGCILGGTNTRFGFYPFAGEDNDGLVLASEATLTQAIDSITIPVLHALFPFSAHATRLSASFLAHGTFHHSEAVVTTL